MSNIYGNKIQVSSFFNFIYDPYIIRVSVSLQWNLLEAISFKKDWKSLNYNEDLNN